jgi:arylsulfatase
MSTTELTRRGFLAAGGGGGAAAGAPQPHVILIYCDDLGYGDLGCYGGKLATPHLDRLAREGMRFTNFYSANPVCSPSRAALLTGRYPTRVNVPRVLFPRDEAGLPPTETTIAAMLKPLGYRTQCVGKWHLGHKPDYLPMRRGFDHYFGIPYSNDMTPRWLMRDAEVIEEQATLETLTPRYTEAALDFIDRSKADPFFLYFAHTYPHIPLAASTRFRGKSPHGIYGDVIAELDWSVGELMARLKRHNLDRNTLVLFSSDNGPWYQGSPGPLRGRKGMTWEGGVRVPLLARMPGRIPAGRVSNGVASTMDVLPTVAQLAGARLPEKPLDGINIWGLLEGRQAAIEREALLYFDDWNLQCARLGPWKLHVARYNNVTYSPAPQGGRRNLPLEPPELYHLDRDPDESYDVAAENPAVVKDMQARIGRLMAGFPEEARTAWAESRARATVHPPAGALPRQKQ